MRLLPVRALLVLIVVFPGAMSAQSSQSVSSQVVPRLINISGVFRPADGQPAGAVETITVSIYADEEGGAPLWQETQTIGLDGQGRYALLLGAGQPDGIPASVFGAGEARWRGTVFARAGEVEGARVRITSVPYALRASDADTLGGRPASAYVLAPPTGDHASGRAASASSTDVPPAADVVLPGTQNFLAKYVNGADVGNSAVYESNGMVGVGTTTPLDYVHVRFTDTAGGATGLAVQNLGNTATSYSGTLFYDQFGALGQFQGFNNVTHEYRINNIARVSPGGAFNGSINFMLGGASKFIVASNGNIGIGTTTPSALLEVSNASNSNTTGTLVATTFANAANSLIVGSRARGTSGAPAGVQNGDALVGFLGRGYGATNFSGTRGGMFVSAAENWTDTAQGTRLNFNTTTTGTITPGTRMTIASNGNVGIGTGVPETALEIARNGDAIVSVDAFGADVAAGVALRTARGTQAAPTAVQSGEILGYFALGGWTGPLPTGGFADAQAGMAAYAAENWTPTTRGAGLGFFTTPIGLPEEPTELPQVVILPSGDVGIGTGVDVNGLPTVTDKLQVVGNIRVGTTGTDGCLKNFAGTGIAGTCASDRRYKKDITPFGYVLNQLTALQPVHYFWRAAEFPEQHFGNGRAYGLIAQEVEQTLPELVVTNDDGFKAVDYSQLPLLTIQAVKDLKSENDALKQRVADLEKSDPEALKRRVAELERLVNDLLATSPRR